MYKKYKLLLIFLIVFALLINVFVPAYASEKQSISSIYTNPHNFDEQWRFIIVKKDKRWTKWSVLSGQKITHLKKGDMLYYSDAGGKTASVSFGISFGTAYANASTTVSFDVPLGKPAGSYGKCLVAHKNGYYVIRAKKEIKPTIQFIQYRYKRNGKWQSWTKPKVYSKKYTVCRVNSELLEKK